MSNPALIAEIFQAWLSKHSERWLLECGSVYTKVCDARFKPNLVLSSDMTMQKIQTLGVEHMMVKSASSCQVIDDS